MPFIKNHNRYSNQGGGITFPDSDLDFLNLPLKGVKIDCSTNSHHPDPKAISQYRTFTPKLNGSL